MTTTKTTLRKIILQAFMLCITHAIGAQNNDISAINHYIDFNNEATHGMLIVHRLLENFNQEVNKFVDLESHQINFYSNKDLPGDIFEDTDHWFYDTTPYEWYDIATQQEVNGLSASLNAVASNMRRQLRSINAIRFEAAQFIEKNDLSIRDNQEKIYEILEKGVQLFEDFYLEHKQLKSLVYKFMRSNQIVADPFRGVHLKASQMLDNLRYKKDNDWAQNLDALEKAAASENDKREQGKKLNLFVEGARDFIGSGSVPLEYKLYGKYYYYHNSRLLNYVNRYGNGYVNAYNESIDPSKSIKLMEIPHFYQVIYPNRWMEDVPLISADPIILSLPEKLKNRNISNSNKVLIVDSEVLEIEIFDHQMIDGDIVSVNFNGDWILEDFPLKGKPYPIRIKLNPEGKNYLLLHAVNLGSEPPNTMAMRYSFRGKEETVVLSSDLDASEIIELKLVESF
ncbi:hypothetical protein [Portibacter marinus]|uniref:hypothetical protein n=1 Tax=Portibacter marinus TaxID=2898660 RepID=UPI001F37CB47|nr:hypothetical protein [Portibacter marinus]